MCKKAHSRLSTLTSLAVEAFRHLQIQERLSPMVADAIKTTPDYQVGERGAVERLNAEVIHADNEDLSANETSPMDVYFASLSLMIVDNTNKMLRKAIRVPKASGRAVFCFWGEATLTSVFTLQRSS